MNTVQGVFPVIKSCRIADRLFDLQVVCPSMAQTAKPGQFVLIRPDGFPLRRPVAVCEADPETGVVRFVIGIRGDGTKKLSGLSRGDQVDLMGPLGNGFTLSKNSQSIFVGGGLGIPPLLGAAEFCGSGSRAILGFKDRGQVALVDEFRKSGIPVLLMTDDGSAGRCGLVTSALEEYLTESTDIIYACGPASMLKKVAGIAHEKKIPCQVLMEERMGCGVGACHICVCKTKGKDGGAPVSSRVCKDGPVFDAEKVVF